MRKLIIYVVAMGCSVFAHAAAPDKPLVDDFGLPIDEDNQAILPPPVDHVAKPAKTPAKAPVPKIEVQLTSPKVDKPNDATVPLPKADPRTAAAVARTKTDTKRKPAATGQVTVKGDSKKDAKTPPAATVTKKTETAKVPTPPSEPKVVAPPKSMAQKFPEATIWVFSGPDADESKPVKKADRPTILPAPIARTADGSVSVPKPTPAPTDTKKKDEPTKSAAADLKKEKPGAKPLPAPMSVPKAEVAEKEPAKTEEAAPAPSEPELPAKVDVKVESASAPDAIEPPVVKREEKPQLDLEPAETKVIPFPLKTDRQTIVSRPNPSASTKMDRTLKKQDRFGQSEGDGEGPGMPGQLDEKDGKGSLPEAAVPPAPGGAVESGDVKAGGVAAPELDADAGQSPGDEEQDPSGDKKDAQREARVPPPPASAPKVVMPPVPAKDAEEEDVAAASPIPIERSEPLVEQAPAGIDTYLDSARTPKYIRVNVQGYNVRRTPEFETGRRDNIDFQTVSGSLFAVSRVVPTEEGVATGIYVGGEERWIFMPWSRRRDFQFCESEACFADVAMSLDALSDTARIDPFDLIECRVSGGDSHPPANLGPLPRRPSQAPLPPVVRSKEELAALDAKVNRAPTVKLETSPTGCVVDSRSRPKPNFRAFRSTAEMRRAFIDYMTPFALEVQEATGLPAAVIIGQAALESGWGTSGLFLNTKNIFGHSCWQRGTRKSLELEIFGKTKRVSGVCDTPRPAYAGGYYMTFRDSQDSVYAYAANLLSGSHNYYPQVRAAVRRAKPAPANWREVVDGLKNYDGPNPAYRSLVRDIIVKNNLQKLETKKLCR